MVGYTTVAPSISFERLEKLVKENKHDWSSTVQVEKEIDRDGTRDIRLIDKYGGLSEFKFSEDSIAMRSRSACLPTDKPLDDPGLVRPAVGGGGVPGHARDDQRQHEPGSASGSYADTGC